MNKMDKLVAPRQANLELFAPSTLEKNYLYGYLTENKLENS